jgi:hypothetical protein
MSRVWVRSRRIGGRSSSSIYPERCPRGPHPSRDAACEQTVLPHRRGLCDPPRPPLGRIVSAYTFDQPRLEIDMSDTRLNYRSVHRVRQWLHVLGCRRRLSLRPARRSQVPRESRNHPLSRPRGPTEGVGGPARFASRSRRGSKKRYEQKQCHPCAQNAPTHLPGHPSQRPRLRRSFGDGNRFRVPLLQSDRVRQVHARREGVKRWVVGPTRGPSEARPSAYVYLQDLDALHRRYRSQ